MLSGILPESSQNENIRFKIEGPLASPGIELAHRLWE